MQSFFKKKKIFHLKDTFFFPFCTVMYKLKLTGGEFLLFFFLLFCKINILQLYIERFK